MTGCKGDGNAGQWGRKDGGNAAQPQGHKTILHSAKATRDLHPAHRRQ